VEKDFVLSGSLDSAESLDLTFSGEPIQFVSQVEAHGFGGFESL
jgi:hypothetical protein